MTGLREHKSEKCNSEGCGKPAVYKLCTLGEAVEYVGSDGEWHQWVEDTEGYDAYYCEEHAEKQWPLNVKQIREVVEEEVGGQA